MSILFSGTQPLSNFVPGHSLPLSYELLAAGSNYDIYHPTNRMRSICCYCIHWSLQYDKYYYT